MNGAAFRFRWEVLDHQNGELSPYMSVRSRDLEPETDADLFLTTTSFMTVAREESTVGLRREYQPLSDFPALFEFFARTETTASGVELFAGRFGLLGLKEYPEPLRTWFSEIDALRKLIALWKALQEDDFDSLHRILYSGDPPLGTLPGDPSRLDAVDPTVALKVALTTLRGVPIQHASRWRPGSQDEKEILRGQVLLHMSGVIDTHLSPLIRTGVFLASDKPSLDLSVVPKNLLGAIWLQFAMAITGNKRFADCEVCRKPFEVKKGTRKTCSDKCRKALSRAKQTEKGDAK